MNYHFLFIYSKENQAFVRALGQVLQPYGDVDSSAWDDLQILKLEQYTLVFLDAGIIADTAEGDNLTSIISLFRTYSPETNVIITTASPTWRRAKEALQAGALDYIRQSLDLERLRREMDAIINDYILNNKNILREP